MTPRLPLQFRSTSRTRPRSSADAFLTSSGGVARIAFITLLRASFEAAQEAKSECKIEPIND